MDDKMSQEMSKKEQQFSVKYYIGYNKFQVAILVHQEIVDVMIFPVKYDKYMTT